MFDDGQFVNTPIEKEEYEKWEHKEAADNACANIKTEDLENGAIKKLVEAGRTILKASDRNGGVNINQDNNQYLESALEPFKEVK